MVNVSQFRRYVLEPTLGRLALIDPRLDTPAAQELVLGTMLHESRLEFLQQHPRGPAAGFCQMEPPTFEWMVSWIMARRPWNEAYQALLAPWPTPFEQLRTNMSYAVAACRWRFWVARAPLPAVDDTIGMGRYHDRYYQTVVDEQEPQRWVATYQRYGAASRRLA